MWSKQLDQCIRLNSLGQQEAHWEIQRSFFKSRLSAWAYCTIIEELKAVLSMVTGLEPREQRLLFSGKEREDDDHLHMVGVRDMDKVLLLEDPALKDMKLRATLAAQTAQSPYRPFIKV